jgi:chromosome segregation ATPase
MMDTSMYVGPGARAQLYRDRIEAMTIDNSSLQRRLNQVGAELDRITDEKDELQRQLQFHKNDNDRVQSMIDH